MSKMLQTKESATSMALVTANANNFAASPPATVAGVQVDSVSTPVIGTRSAIIPGDSDGGVLGCCC